MRQVGEEEEGESSRKINARGRFKKSDTNTKAEKERERMTERRAQRESERERGDQCSL